MGKQFYHFEAYSRTVSNSKAKGGASIYSIAGEAERTPGYCEHVEKPKEHILLLGVPFSEVVKLSENYAANTFDSIGRAVRKNGFCMIAGVVSASHDMTEKVWEAYKKNSIDYLKKTWGDSLKSIIEHRDEYFEPDPEMGIKKRTLHRHIHFACVPPVGVNFVEIHPGIKAKRAADKAYGVTKIPDGLDEDDFKIFKKEGRKDGDKAYRKAMRLVQDDFFINVSDRFGLLRYGPKRLRLTRQEIINREHEKRLRQKNAVDLVEQEEKAKEQEIEIKKAKHDLKKIKSEAKKIEANLKKQEQTVSDSEKKIKEREKKLDLAERQSENFKKGLKTNLRGWQLPKPFFWELADHYIKRVTGEVMGIVKRALNIINKYSLKKEELEKEKEEFEKEKEERQKQEVARKAALDKTHSEEVSRWTEAYGKLKNKVLGIKTIQELNVIKNELSYSRPFSK